MNKVFKVVYSKSKGCYVVVPETAKNNNGKKKVLASVLAGLAVAGAMGGIAPQEAQALEDAILDVMAKDQENVSNEELRHYMNETIWFAAKQTVKNKASEEPTVQDEHVVNLREAINRPANQEVKKVDLRAAIQ